MKPRSAKAKGTRLERWAADELNRIGIAARKQPGSGVYSDFPHDLWCELPDGSPAIGECKSWKNGWRTGDNAIGAADFLIIKRDYGTPCVYMTWDFFSRILLLDRPAADISVATPVDPGAEKERVRIPSRPFPTKPEGYVSPLSKGARASRKGPG